MAIVVKSHNRRKMTYVRDIPLLIRQQLCRILDASGPGQNWKQLAALLGCTADECYSFERVLYTPGGSPTDEMLRVWDFGNHTITELFNHLYHMKHARGMQLLKDLVDAVHHDKITKIQGEQPVDASDTDIYQSNPYMPACRQPPHGHEPPTKLYPENQRPLNLPHQMTNQVQGSDSSSSTIPISGSSPGINQNHLPKPPSGFRNNSDLGGHFPSQLSLNGSPSPSIQSNSRENASVLHQPPQFKDGFLVNLDGGTEKQINSPLMKPCYESNGKLSNDNNVGSKISNPAQASRMKKSSREEKERLAQLTVMSSVMTLKYEDIKRATNDFSESHKVGAGSFGTVYYMKYNHTKYAIKRLMQDGDHNSPNNASRLSSQMKELTHLATYRHENVVTLCYNCTDGPEPCLVYEYMQNGSLEDNLQLRMHLKEPFDWTLRNRIVLGSAIGLNFLHNAQEHSLIHGDIKSANILLDENFKPKIGDFGLARFGPEKGKSYTYLRTRKAYGTMPYLPMDFLANFKLSDKVDVYSFGIVLMEVLTGQKAADEKREPKTKLLIDIVVEVVNNLKYEEDSQQKIIAEVCDKRCKDWPWDLSWAMLELALQCTHKFHQRRPKMQEVVHTLQQINNRILERDSLRKRSCPIQNTEPLAGHREPQESYYGSISGELRDQVGQQRVQDSQVTSGSPQKITPEMSPIEKRLRDLGLQADSTSAAPEDRAFAHYPPHVTCEQARFAGDYQSQPHRLWDLGLQANGISAATEDRAFSQYPQRFAGDYQHHLHRPLNMPQDLRSVSQDPGTYGYGMANGFPQESFPTGATSTVPSSYMNRPTPPSTATNPPLSNAQYGARFGFPQRQTHLKHMEYQRQCGFDPHPQYQYGPYQPHENGNHVAGRYAPNNRTLWQQGRPQYYDNLPSLNPAFFSPAPTPSVNQYTNIQGHMAELDTTQLPGIYTHRGPDSSTATSVTSRNTPPLPTPEVTPECQRNTASPQQQMSYVQFPHSLLPSHSLESVGHHKTPVQQTDVLPNPKLTTTYAAASEEACTSVHKTISSEGTSEPVRHSPVPAVEHDTDIVTSLNQLHLNVSMSDQSADSSDQLASPAIASSLKCQRKKPVPTQNTDMLTCHELQCEDSETCSTNLARDEDPPHYHSAPPGSTENMSSSTRPRIATQMTEPLFEPHQRWE